MGTPVILMARGHGFLGPLQMKLETSGSIKLADFDRDENHDIQVHPSIWKVHSVIFFGPLEMVPLGKTQPCAMVSFLVVGRDGHR